VPADYEKDEKHKHITLTDAGNEHVEGLQELGLLTEGGLYDAHNISLVHHVNQALRAHKIFNKRCRLHRQGRQGHHHRRIHRPHDGRPPLFDGLHQALEAKEGVKIQNENQTLASVTFQNYFRIYPKLAGMTGTAMTEKDEFDMIYNLRAVEIPTNMPAVRLDHHDEIYRTSEEKYEAIIGQIQECIDRQQPVLVGTTSIEKSEQLSKRLKKLGIEHKVLNARYHEQEAHIIAQAGKPGAVTIATNMAGRGTDIKLGGNVDMRLMEEIPVEADPSIRDRLTAEIRREVAEAYEIVKSSGGLFIIGSERHESRRIDNQLRGRAGRQGDPGASKFYISLEDDLMRIFGSEKMDMFLQRMGLKPGQPIIHPWINTAIERAQKKVEAQHFEVRKNLLKYDNVMNDQRKIVYEQRREVMTSEDVSDIIRDMRHDAIEGMVGTAIPPGSYAEQWDITLLKGEAQRILGLHIPAEEWVKEEGLDEHTVIERLTKMSDEKMSAKENIVSPVQMRRLERDVLLQLLDQTWKEHLLGLDYLRQGIMLRAFGQKDPLNEYKTEAFAMFQDMLNILREKVTSLLCLIEFQQDLPPPPLLRPRQAGPVVESHGNAAPEPQSKTVTSPAFNQAEPATWAQTPRNAACPCGSGKKYKYCHGQAA
jgi:preprotein translocase subunit SecA